MGGVGAVGLSTKLANHLLPSGPTVTARTSLPGIPCAVVHAFQRSSRTSVGVPRVSRYTTPWRVANQTPPAASMSTWSTVSSDSRLWNRHAPFAHRDVTGVWASADGASDGGTRRRGASVAGARRSRAARRLAARPSRSRARRPSLRRRGRVGSRAARSIVDASVPGASATGASAVCASGIDASSVASGSRDHVACAIHHRAVARIRPSIGCCRSIGGPAVPAPAAHQHEQ